MQIIEDNEDPRQIHKWLLVFRDEIGKLRVGTRTAGIATGEFQALNLRRIQLAFRTKLICVGVLLGSLKDANLKAALVSLFVEIQMQIAALSPTAIRIYVRDAKHRSIAELDEAWCWTSLRFRIYEIHRIANHSGLTADAVCRADNRMKFSGETVLIVGMFACSRPRTEEDIAYEFGFSNQSVVSRILALFYDIFLERYAHLIQDESDDAFLIWTPYVRTFVNRIRMQWPDYPEDMADCGCFVDGSANYTCRPIQRDDHSLLGLDTQRAWYNSYYGNHGQKFQGVVAPNGLFLQMWGPVSIRVHDSPLVIASRLNEKLRRLSAHSGVTIKAHGDSAYPRRSHLVKNTSYAMSQKRIVNEWAFGKMQQNFSVTDFEANLKVYLNRPARTYLVCTLLCNMHSCCYGSNCATYFRCPAPSLEEYLSM